jgi:hypothetical protein
MQFREYDNGYGGISAGFSMPPPSSNRIGPPMETPRGEEDFTILTDEGLAGLRRLGSAAKFLTILAFCLMITGFISVFFFELSTTDWFNSFFSWLVLIPLLLLMGLWPTLYIAYKRNWISSTYSLFVGLYGLLSILMLAMLIWVLVQWFWYCPTFKPDVCTDGSSSTIETGFIIYAAVVIGETVMIFAFLFVMWAMRGYYRKIFNGLGNMDKSKAANILYDAMFRGITHSITGFGSEMASLRSNY